jgi:hypothetical protein
MRILWQYQAGDAWREAMPWPDAAAAGVPASEVFPESTPGSLLRGARIRTRPISRDNRTPSPHGNTPTGLFSFHVPAPRQGPPSPPGAGFWSVLSAAARRLRKRNRAGFDMVIFVPGV